MNLHKPNSGKSSPREAPRCPGNLLPRRTFLKHLASTTAIIAAGIPPQSTADQTPQFTPRRDVTSIGLCKRYEYREVRRALGHMLDELGGLRRLVKGKQVTVKVNLVNSSEESLGGLPLGLTVTVHPNVALALGSLLVDYGARRVLFCDQLPFPALDAGAFSGYGFQLQDFLQATSGKVRFENTRNRGSYREYAMVRVPNGELATAWEVHPAYVQTDVLVSLTKLKSHVSAGISGGMKNLFGIPPSSLYGDDLKDHPDEGALGYRNQCMHSCVRKPFTSADYFAGASVRDDHGFNVPRFVVDLAAAFPVDLVVIDGISTIQSAEGWWNGSMVSVTRPGLLIAGKNPVCTDAVAAAVMGFDPDAPDRTHPFANGTNHLALARRRGLGENRIRNLDIAGCGLDAARFEFQPTYQRIHT